MEEMMKALMKKKKSEHDMPDHEKAAKMHVLHQIHKMASDAMGDDIKGLKKVTVASNDDQGLQEGLAHAKQMLAAHHPDRDDDADAEGVSHDMRPGKRHEVDNKDELSDEEPEEKDEDHSRGMHNMSPAEMKHDDHKMKGYARGGMIDDRGEPIAEEGEFDPNAHKGPHGGKYNEQDPKGDMHGNPDEVADDLGDMHDDEISALIAHLSDKLAKRKQ